MPTWSPGFDACGLEMVGEAVGPLLHLRVGAALSVADHEVAVGEIVDRVLEEIGQVVLHGFSRTRFSFDRQPVQAVC